MSASPESGYETHCSRADNRCDATCSRVDRIRDSCPHVLPALLNSLHLLRIRRDCQRLCCGPLRKVKERYETPSYRLLHFEQRRSGRFTQAEIPADPRQRQRIEREIIEAARMRGDDLQKLPIIGGSSNAPASSVSVNA
jgi:hypothetical protein